jgi:dihydropteroate synthase
MATWTLGRKTYVMGIVNVTPDSFSDGGRYFSADDALVQAQALIADGADILDVGAESTRPQYVPITAEEEWARLEPVLAVLCRESPVPISVDTRKAAVASRAVALGAAVINDISGLQDGAMVDVLRSSRVGYVLTYHTETSLPSGVAISSRTVIRPWLISKLESLQAEGIAGDRILVDPGLGFSYPVESNWSVLQDVQALEGLGAGLLLGPSRKRFLGMIGGKLAEQRDPHTAWLAAALVSKGMDVVRVHNVGLVRQAVQVADKLRWEA